MPSRVGQLLVASPKLVDPSFARTVTLIVEHSEESGALGLVLNRPTETRMADAWESALGGLGGPCEHDGLIFQGGPCEGPLMAMHTHAERSQFTPVEGVQVTADKEDLEWLMANNREPMRCFVNYSGWGPSQLEAEIETASWLLVPASARDVFLEPGRLWAELLRRIDPVQAALALNPRIRPSDPRHN